MYKLVFRRMVSDSDREEKEMYFILNFTKLTCNLLKRK